jgi:4'-phosphopantetheinyl transferase
MLRRDGEARASALPSWRCPILSAPIRADEIHVWRACLDPPAATVQRLRQILSPDEGRRADRHLSERHSRRFVVGRSTLRGILGWYLGIDAAVLTFVYGTGGKPALPEKTADGLRFNMSHSGELALYAVTRDRDVGIDIERRRPITSASKIVERFFSTAEKAAYRALPAGEREDAFLRAWTRKEAYVKAHGKGFSLPFRRFDVSLAAVSQAEPVRDRGDRTEWLIWHLEPHPDYFAAVAAQGSSGRLERWNWELSLLRV